MTAIEVPLSLSSQQSLVKMDERKRPSPYDQVESAPPLKKHQSSANGASKAHKDDDMPWKDDLEVSTFSSASTCAPLPFTSILTCFSRAEVPERCHLSTNARVSKGKEHIRDTTERDAKKDKIPR